MRNELINFMNGYSAAVDLMSRAAKNGFSIEYICLSAIVIDCALRMALILKNQLEKQSNDIMNNLLFQSNEDKIVSEREIYKRSLDKNIISSDLFNQLESLYKMRNKVVHRYIISNITTDKVYNIAMQYEKIVPFIAQVTRELEEKQITLGIGMTIKGSDVPEKFRDNVESRFESMSQEKHGDLNLARKLKKE